MKKLAFLVMLYFQTSSTWSVTLDELIQKGLLSYPSVLSGVYSRNAAQTELTASKLRFLPNPSFSTQRQSIAYSGQPTSREPATNISITQPLLIDGGIIASYNKAEARLGAADYMLLEARDDVSKRIISAYVEWLKAWQKIQALEESMRLYEKFVGMISRRFEQGVASGSDKNLAVSRLLQAQADLDTQRSVESTALTSISELVGESVNRSDLSGEIAKALTMPKRVDGIGRAMAVGVTIERAKFEAEAAQQEAKEIRAQALPQLSLQAQRQVGNAYLPGAPGFNMFGLVVTYSPNGGLSNIVGARAAFERAAGATYRIDLARRELMDRLSAEYNEYEYSLLKKEGLLRSVGLSGDLTASYDRQYLVGRKSWLELMNSVREKAQAKVQLADVEGALVGSSRRLMVYIEPAHLGAHRDDN